MPEIAVPATGRLLDQLFAQGVTLDDAFDATPVVYLLRDARDYDNRQGKQQDPYKLQTVMYGCGMDGPMKWWKKA